MQSRSAGTCRVTPDATGCNIGAYYDNTQRSRRRRSRSRHGCWPRWILVVGGECFGPGLPITVNLSMTTNTLTGNDVGSSSSTAMQRAMRRPPRQTMP